MSAHTQFDADIIVAGGGMAGLVTGLALAHAGVDVIVIDAAPLSKRLDAAFDGRASAIAYANFRMLDVLGVGDRLREAACRINDIVVSDGRAPDGLRRGGPGPAFLKFSADELPARGADPLGWMVENRAMRAALADALAAAPSARHLAPARINTVRWTPRAGEVVLNDGAVLKAACVVGADGAFSAVRQAAGVRTFGWEYPQHGVVATVAMAKDHGNIAHEYFLPSGPFAILPLNGQRASLVWTEKSRAAKAAMALPVDQFAAELRRRFGDFLGQVNLAGPRWSYPLGLCVAEQFIAPRAVLVGDAARRIHPIAGQGFNLGLKDAAALAEVMAEARHAGLDLGAGDVLERYQSWRRFDSVLMAMATDGLNRLFSNDLSPIRALRGAGLSLVHRIAPARKLFARDAGGDVGDLPKLLRGEALV